MTKNGQSAAKPLSEISYEEGSTTIETTLIGDKGVEYTNAISGKGRDFCNKNCYVYKHTRLDTNNIFYIGIGSSKNFNRAYSVNGRNKYWNRIISKTNYVVEILYNNISWIQAQLLEKDLIKQFGRKNNSTGILCNMTDGGEGSLGCMPSIETRKKQSNSLKGIIFTKERKDNISKAKKGLKFTKIHCENLSKALKGRIIPQETRDNMSHGKREIYQLLDGVVVNKWSSIKEASLYYNVNQSSISHCCAGRKNKIKGFVWKYCEDYDIVYPI